MLRGGSRSRCAWEARDQPEYPNFAGVRFCSRLGEWECWAVFEDVLPEEQERISILRQDSALQRVAKLYELEVF